MHLIWCYFFLEMKFLFHNIILIYGIGRNASIPHRHPLTVLCSSMLIPRRKGTRIRAVYCRKYADFTRNFARITARYRPKPFISGAIENKRQKGALRSCARSNLRLLSFNVPEYRALQAYFNVETPALLNFEPFVPARFGVTGCRTVIISRTIARYCVVPTNARANRAFTRSFSPGLKAV